MGCWARYVLWLVITLLGVGNMVTACGHKGPLYLPDRQTPQEDSAPPPAEDR